MILYRHIQIIIMKFDWDDEKAELNLKNHGVSFDEASEVFFDDWAIEEFDTKHSDFNEQRLTIIGLSKNRLLRVTYTVRLNESNVEIVRIISARIAKGYQKQDYEQSRNEFDR